jgi:hypothetical protein
MLSLNIPWLPVSSWTYSDEPQFSGAILRGCQLNLDETEEDSNEHHLVAIIIKKDRGENDAQDLMVLGLEDDDEIDYDDDGDSSIIIVVDDELKIMTEISSELGASRAVFYMSKQLIAILFVAKKINFVYTLVNGDRRMALFETSEPLEWSLESEIRS